MFTKNMIFAINLNIGKVIAEAAFIANFLSWFFNTQQVSHHVTWKTQKKWEALDNKYNPFRDKLNKSQPWTKNLTLIITS